MSQFDYTIMSNLLKQKARTFCLLFFAFFIVACGGGSGGDEDTTDRDVGDNPGDGDTTVEETTDSVPPVISILGDNPTTLVAGSTYSDSGASASDDVDGNITANIVVTDSVNSAVAGSYSVTYTVSDAAGNQTTKARSVVVEAAPVVDTTAPVISILGDNPTTLVAGSTYSDSGASASDDVDGNITANIVVTDSVNSAVAGSYSVTYTVSDAAGNQTTKARSVVVEAAPVVDTTAPVISILGDNPASVELGTSYNDVGATATDDIDGNLSSSIQTTGVVNTSELGIYTITYSVGDSAGNNASEDRSVEVYNTLPTSLNQAAYEGGTVYRYGHNSIPNIMLSGAPADTDRSRWAMLHDAGEYRLYFFKKGSNDTFYQFAYNPSTGVYQWGYNSIPTLKVTGMPTDADPSSFAMLHDGSAYRFYMQSESTNSLYQAAYNISSGDYEYGFNSIENLPLTGGPTDTEYSRWGMLHDGEDYRFYAFKAGSDTHFYQFAYNISSGNYEYGFNSILQLSVQDMPSTSERTSFAMLHDGSAYRFYFQNNDL